MVCPHFFFVVLVLQKKEQPGVVVKNQCQKENCCFLPIDLDAGSDNQLGVINEIFIFTVNFWWLWDSGP